MPAIGLSDLTDFFASLDAAVGQSRVERALSVRFDLGVAGTWTLRASPLEAGSVERDAPDATLDATDCTLTCALDVLLDLANGRRKPAVAFMKGLIGVRGDKSVFVALQPIIRRAARDFKAQREAQTQAGAPAGSVRVIVHGASVVADSRESFAVYLLEVFEGESRWTLTRRWSEVRALARRVRRLKASVVGGAKLPALPRTLDFAGSLEQNFLAKRAEIISSYLSDALGAVPCSVLHASGPCPALRLFLSPNEVGDTPGGPMSPLASPVAPTPNARRTSMMTDERDSTLMNGFESFNGVHALRTSASFGGRASGSGAMLSPGWLPLNSPAPLSPSHSMSTRRIEDVYSPLSSNDADTPAHMQQRGGGDDDGGNNGARQDDVGHLVEMLLAAAATQPIRAEHDETTLEARRGVLRRLRTFEALSKGDTFSMKAMKLAAKVVDIACRFLLPAALGMAAAAYGWALAMLVLWRSAGMYLLKCDTWQRAVALAALGGLAILASEHYHPYASIENGASTAGSAAAAAAAAAAATVDPTLAEQQDSNDTAGMAAADAATTAAGAAAAAVPSLATPFPLSELLARTPAAWHPMLITAHGIALSWLSDSRATSVADAGGKAATLVAETLQGAPIRSAGVLSVWLLMLLINVLFGRLVRVYSVGFSVVFAYWMLGQVSEAIAKRSSFYRSYEDSLWSMIHNVVAPSVCGTFVELKSVFVKFGQYLGGRADIVPPEWAASLRLLQDDLPACPPSHLRATIKDEFGAALSSLFEDIDPVPIASASVAQVHVGRLVPSRSTAADKELGIGTKVVLKLQHRAIEPLMRKDMVACLRLCTFAKWLNPDFHAMYTVMDAWQHEMYHEFNFQTEADNLRLVRQNLRRAGIDALVPQPIDGLVGVRAFAMTFEDGFKISDEEALAMHAVDREALMVRVVQIYAQQLFVDGFFNADPHAGNLMVAVQDGRAIPVLLDFGMTVKLTDQERLAYAELAFAAQQMDIQRLQSAVRALGIKNNQMDKDPSRDLDFWRFFLRDTGKREQARTQANAFFKRKVNERREDQAKGEETRKLQSLPASFVFFWRVIGLLRGLCASLNVEVPYMDILAARAKVALARLTPAPQRALSIAPPLEPLPSALAPLHQRLASLCMQLCAEGSVQAGVQVCVQRNSATLAEAAAGFRGVIDPRGMLVDVPMPLLELSGLVPVLAVHQLVASGRARYNEPLKESWPGCEAAAKAGYTVADALGLRIPLDGSSMWKQPVHELSNLDSQQRKVAAMAVPPAPSPTERQPRLPDTPRRGGSPVMGGSSSSSSEGSTPKSSATANATLLAGIVMGVTGGTYLRELESRLIEPLGLSGLLHPGMLSEQKQKEAATASTGFGAQLQRFSAMRPQAAGEDGGGGGGGNGVAHAEGKNGEAKADDGANGETKAEEEGEEEEAEATAGNGPDAASRFAHEIPLNAGMVNDAQVREGCVPGLGGFATARGLCILLGAAARGETGSLSSLSVESGTEMSTIYGERIWVRGMQRYECTGGTEAHVLGCHSFSGSFAFCCPRSGVSVAILLNDGQLDYSVTRRILEAISEELGIGQIDFLGGGLF